MQLDTLFNIENTITIGGHQVKIKQISLGDIPLLTELMSKVFDKEKKKPTKDILMDLIKQDSQKIFSVIASLTDIPAEKVPTLNLTAAVLICSEILKENADFLQQNLAPEMEKMKVVMGSLTKSKS